MSGAAFAHLRPMLATAAPDVAHLPDDGGRWAYEVKWDGVRVLTHLRGGVLRLASRVGNEVTPAYPELAGLATAHPDVVLDGEMVVLRDGLPSFSALAERMHVRDARRAAELAARSPAQLFVFDLLALDGEELTALTWTERRALLEPLVDGIEEARLSPVFDDRDVLVEATRQQGLEGVVAKRRRSRYHPGRRSGDWVKLAHKRMQAVVVGGWRWETGARDRLGSLLIGVPEGEGKLTFAGRVGSGLTGITAMQLRNTLVSAQHSPFTSPVPAVDAKDTQWTTPEVVVEVRYLGKVEGGRLRHPVFRGIRTDLRPDDVRWEG